MKCNNCGAELGEGDAFCKNCGTPVQNTNPAASQGIPEQKTNPMQTQGGAQTIPPMGGAKPIQSTPSGQMNNNYMGGNSNFSSQNFGTNNGGYGGYNNNYNNNYANNYSGNYGGGYSGKSSNTADIIKIVACVAVVVIILIAGILIFRAVSNKDENITPTSGNGGTSNVYNGGSSNSKNSGSSSNSGSNTGSSSSTGTNSNTGYGSSSSGTTTSGTKVNINGYNFTLSSDMICETEYGKTIIADEDLTWGAYIQVMSGASYSDIKSKLSSIKQAVLTQGAAQGITAEDPEVETIGGMELITMKCYYSGEEVMAAYAPLDSSHVIVVSLQPLIGSVDSSDLEPLIPVLKSAKYAGSSVGLDSSLGMEIEEDDDGEDELVDILSEILPTEE